MSHWWIFGAGIISTGGMVFSFVSGNNEGAFVSGFIALAQFIFFGHLMDKDAERIHQIQERKFAQVGRDLFNARADIVRLGVQVERGNERIKRMIRESGKK